MERTHWPWKHDEFVVYENGGLCQTYPEFLIVYERINVECKAHTFQQVMCKKFNDTEVRFCTILTTKWRHSTVLLKHDVLELANDHWTESFPLVNGWSLISRTKKGNAKANEADGKLECIFALQPSEAFRLSFAQP